MSHEAPEKRGRYFEEFTEGEQITSMGRTVTESDIVRFAGLSGDYNQIHVDAEFSKNAAFGQRVAHGLLGLSIASGLVVQTGVMEGTIMAFRKVDNWTFVKPIFIGDTIHVVVEVAQAKAIPRIGGGSLELAMDVKNQSGETVMKGSWTVLVESKPD